MNYSSIGTSSSNNNGMEGEVMVSIGEKDELELEIVLWMIVFL